MHNDNGSTLNRQAKQTDDIRIPHTKYSTFIHWRKAWEKLEKKSVVFSMSIFMSKMGK